MAKEVLKVSPYTGNHVHTSYMVRKEVNGHSFPWKTVLWECQSCLRSFTNPSWCCPKCGCYAIYVTEKGYDNARSNEARELRREQDAIRRECDGIIPKERQWEQ